MTLESMPLEAVMAPEPASVLATEGVPTATAVAPARVRGRAADEEQRCDQCGESALVATSQIIQVEGRQDGLGRGAVEALAVAEWPALVGLA